MGRVWLACVLLLGCRTNFGGSEDDQGPSGGSSPPSAQTTDDTTLNPTTDATPTGDGSGTIGSSSSTGEPAPPEPPDLPFLPPDCPAIVQLDDVFDPSQVYLFGTLSEGTGGRQAVAHWSTPDHAVVGWGDGVNNFQVYVRPTDGRMLYNDVIVPAVREFHCDTCPWEDGASYPMMAEENDPIIGECTPLGATFLEFLVAPDGTFLTRCSGAWYDSTGESRYAGEAGSLLHLGYDDWALGQAGVVSLVDGSVAAELSPQLGETIAIRADPAGGFFVVLGEHAAPEMVHVALDGAMESVGVFPPLPEGHLAFEGGVLDGCLALYQQGRGPDTSEDLILRRALDDETRIVYTEALEPVVKIHISTLMTGV